MPKRSGHHAVLHSVAPEDAAALRPKLNFRPNMNEASKERYVFHHLTLIDMERAVTSIQYLSTVTDRHLREVLFRDAVVCYAKSFSNNRGIKGRSGVQIGKGFIPSELVPAHSEILDFRNKLFAHVDLDHQAPEVSFEIFEGRVHPSFVVNGYERGVAEHLIDPLCILAKMVHSYCLEQLRSIEADYCVESEGAARTEGSA
jgi:hypothetical protein